jgi:hypothetical protein
MITGMTIARDFASEPAFDGAGPERDPSGTHVGLPVPFELRAERLARQVQSFERAGYRLETQSALQAVVVKRGETRPLRTVLLVLATAGLYLVPVLLGASRTYHRVVITVDGSGAVRLA